jgi:hypothetical protein
METTLKKCSNTARDWKRSSETPPEIPIPPSASRSRGGLGNLPHVPPGNANGFRERGCRLVVYQPDKLPEVSPLRALLTRCCSVECGIQKAGPAPE